MAISNPQKRTHGPWAKGVDAEVVGGVRSRFRLHLIRWVRLSSYDGVLSVLDFSPYGRVSGSVTRRRSLFLCRKGIIMKKKTVFTGAATALITPFDENGVNYEKLGTLIDWLLNL